MRCSMTDTVDSAKRSWPGKGKVARLLDRKGVLVDALGNQRVEDVGRRHQARRDRNRVAPQAVRIARTIPSLVMRTGDLLRHAQEFDRRVVGVLFRLLDRLIAEVAVRFHDFPFLRGQPAGFEQDFVADSHLADVVQRSGFVEHLDVPWCQKVGETRMRADFLRQGANVALCSTQVAASFRVPDLGQPPCDLRLQAAILVAQQFASGGDHRPDRPRNVVGGPQLQATRFIDAAIEQHLLALIGRRLPLSSLAVCRQRRRRLERTPCQLPLSRTRAAGCPSWGRATSFGY